MRTILDVYGELHVSRFSEKDTWKVSEDRFSEDVATLRQLV